jgi:hypothetical protein
MLGQDTINQKKIHAYQHFLSVNPLNMAYFQQYGATYEYKPRRFGFGIYAGYIYPNHKDYSNFFIAGPTENGSLGDYSGFFLEPMVNFYFTKQKHEHSASLIYLSLKGVYKYMQLDSTHVTRWLQNDIGDGYYDWRKMIDKVNIYGGFLDFGYRYVLYHVFFDVNFGFGILDVTHKMTISGENPTSLDPYPMNYYHPAKTETVRQTLPTINFTLTFGLTL